MQRRVIIYAAITLKSSVLEPTPLCYALHIYRKKKKKEMVLVLMRLQLKPSIKQKTKVGSSSGEDNEKLLITVRGRNPSV